MIYYMQNNLSIYSSGAHQWWLSIDHNIVSHMFRGVGITEMNDICLPLLYIAYWGRWICTWKFLIQNGNCFNVNICRTTGEMDSDGIVERLQKWKHHLSLAFRMRTLWLLCSCRWGERKQILQRGRTHTVLFHFVEKAGNILLHAFLNDADMERWANIQRPKRQ